MINYQNKTYVPGFDAFRGVAVILVLLIHWGVTSAGWVGVQAFFVLSGYLITKNLTISRINNNSLKSYLKIFYLKRFLRLAPVYYLYIICFYLINLFYFDLVNINDIILPAIAYCINFYALSANSLLLDGIGHFWSLAVEEQFYLVWPFVCFYMSKKNLKVLLYILILIGPFIRFIIFQAAFICTNNFIYSGQSVYFLPFGQMDSFAIGALLTFVSIKPSPYIIRFFWAFILIFILISFTNFYIEDGLNNLKSRVLSFGFPHLMLKNFQYVWGYSLLNILFALIIYMIIIQKNQITLLNSNLLASLGRISYGVYIFHVPVLALLKKNTFETFSVQGLVMIIAYFFFTILIAFFSFKYFEKPFIHIKNKL
jgi:peptidoglycan/LPS O-acetylase OafA/YrhL